MLKVTETRSAIRDSSFADTWSRTRVRAGESIRGNVNVEDDRVIIDSLCEDSHVGVE